MDEGWAREGCKGWGAESRRRDEAVSSRARLKTVRAKAQGRGLEMRFQKYKNVNLKSPQSYAKSRKDEGT